MFRCPGASFSRSKIWIWTHPIYQNIGGSFANVWISIPNSCGLWIIMSANLPYPGAVAALSRSLCCGGRAVQIRALCVQTSQTTVAHMSCVFLEKAWCLHHFAVLVSLQRCAL